MYKALICLIITLFLSSCSIFQVHKMDIEQGNVMTPAMISQLHTGMSEENVREVMGNPVLVNIFTPNRLDYVYTFEKGHGKFTITRVICHFRNGRLTEIQRY